MARTRHAGQRMVGGEAATRMRRRGLMAGAAALVTALMVKEAVEAPRVAALDDPLVGAQVVNVNSVTGVAAVAQYNPSSGTLLLGDASLAAGVTGIFGRAASNAIGVKGSVPDTGYGVQGQAGNGFGVYGSATGGNGVGGVSSSSYGVYGISTSSLGVYGVSSGNHAVFGNLFASTAGTAGVYGYGNGAGTYGVLGNGAIGGIGVYGTASSGYGVVGRANAGDAAALYGISGGANTPAFAAYNGVAGGLAGTFNGKVYITGDFIATGGVKSAAVPHPDGSHRLLYCVESPESWFEDFGEGTLTGGKADVKLDPDFAAVVDTSTLHVFCMPHGDGHHVYLEGRTATGFTVGAEPSASGVTRGLQASGLSGTFSYRVVAKRKDVAAPRLAKVDLPQIPAPPPPPPPEPKPKRPPTPPKA